MRYLVFVYLAAIVAANLSAGKWEEQAVVYNAFLFVALDLATRDRLHDAWGGRGFLHLWSRLGALIVTGSAISYVTSRLFDVGPPGLVGRIAVASCIAFAIAATVDGLVYHWARSRLWLERSNLSNIAGAAADSITFQWIAFGWSFAFIFAQWTAKVAGGLVWSLVLRRRR